MCSFPWLEMEMEKPKMEMAMFKFESVIVDLVPEPLEVILFNFEECF